MLCGFCLRVKSESGSGLKKGWVDWVRMEAGVQEVGCPIEVAGIGCVGFGG